MAEEKTEKKKLREKSFPPDPKGDVHLEQMVRHHAQAGHTLCSEEKCYYPVKKFTHDGNAHIAETVKTPKGMFFKGICSWDPLHGSGDLVAYPDTADGVARIQLIPIPDPKGKE